MFVIESLTQLTMETKTAMKNELLGWSFLLACARENYPRKVFPLRAPLCGKQRWFEEYPCHTKTYFDQDDQEKIILNIPLQFEIFTRGSIIIPNVDYLLYLRLCKMIIRKLFYSGMIIYQVLKTGCNNTEKEWDSLAFH